MGKIKVTKAKKTYYVSGIDEETDTVTYVENKEEATEYGGTFFTTAQIDFLKNYFSEKQPELKKAKPVWD